jgi:hypothetical protein
MVEGGTTHFAVMIIRSLILLLFVVYLVRSTHTGRISFPSARIGWPILAFLVLAAISTARSVYLNQSLQWLLVLASYAALFHLLISFLQEWKDAVKLIIVVIGIAVLEAVWSFIQAASLGAVRPSGSFFNPNFLAGYLVPVCLVVLGYLLYSRSYRHDFVLHRWWTLGRVLALLTGLTVLLIAIVMTGSRGAGLACSAGAAFIVGVRFGRKGLGALALLVLLIMMAPNPLGTRIRAEHAQNPLAYSRWQIWQSSIQMTVDYPLGIGLGLYQYVYPRYATPVQGHIAQYAKVAQSAHNEYLQTAVELGLAAVPVFAWGIILVARECQTVMRRRLHRQQRGLVVGVTAAVVSIFVHATVDSNLHEPSIAILLILCIGVLCSAPRLLGKASEPSYEVSFSFRPVWVVCSFLLAGVLSVAIIRLGMAWMAYEAGNKMAANKNLTQAIEQYQEAIRLDPGKALYHSAIAAAYFRAFQDTGEVKAAENTLSELRAAIALNPLDGRLQGLLGHVYVMMASSTTAGHNDPDALHQKHVLLLQAMVAYRRAAEVEPFTPTYLLELGRLHKALGDQNTAEESAQRAIEIEPNFLPGREWLAKFYLESDRPEEARKQYREIVERQHTYAGWDKDPLESDYLRANAAALASALEQEGSAT